MSVRKKVSAAQYRFIKFWVWLFYPVTSVVGAENLPDEPCIIVGNHAKMNGPIACELYFPGRHRTWTAGEMMHLKEVPAYAYQDFWSMKPAYTRWFYHALSYIIAPLSVCIFNNANCIGVYHDMRIISTFRESVSRLEEGVNVIIFPEHDVPYNNLMWEFQDRFIDVARMYRRKTGKNVCFVPMYVAPRLKTLYLGEPVRYDHTAPKDEERKRICKALAERITEIAAGLPEHTVVPYPNMPAKDYPTNKEVVKK
jgi:1-acyl-sn-glycerol-3-phosphate acyltransferase